MADHETPLDRLSRLPDGILLYILSFMTTLEAVKTSVLSSRWRYLWTSIPLLDFDEYDFLPRLPPEYSDSDSDSESVAAQQSGTDRFKRFINMVLLLRDAASDLQCLHLSWTHWVDMRCANTWIHYAMRRGVRELYLDIWQDGGQLPRALFSCQSLQVLELATFSPLSWDRRLFVSPEVVCLGQLKTLKLTCIPSDRYDPSQLESLQRLISGCPVLENLVLDWLLSDVETLRDDEREDLVTNQTACSEIEYFHMHRCQQSSLRIAAPKLKSLRVTGWPCGNATIQICTPNLLSFDCHDCCFKFSLENLSSLVSASIVAVNWFDTSVLGELYNVANLELSCPYMEFDDVQDPQEDLPTFHNMKKLKLKMFHDFYEVIHLLQHLPNLETLTLENMPLFLESDCDDKQWEFKEEHRKPGASSDFLSHLTTVAIMNSAGTESEQKCLKFLTENAKNLKNVRLVPDPRILQNQLNM